MRFDRFVRIAMVTGSALALLQAPGRSQDRPPQKPPTETPQAASDPTSRLREINKARAQQKHQGQMKPTIEDGIGEPTPAITAIFGPHADLHNYPASVFDELTSCSATLLGPQVALTAAHCAEGGDDHIYFSHGGKVFSAYCVPFPSYDPITHRGDFALCAVEQPGGVTGISVFETLNRDTAQIQIGRDVLLTGFGITSAEGTIGSFNVGAAKVIGAPSTTSNEILLEGATIAPGDSGSAVFIVLNGLTSRRIVAVNSHRVDPPPGSGSRRSSATSISVQQATDFINEWMHQHPGVTLCGYTVGALNCQP
jgi:hypothetical protein